MRENNLGEIDIDSCKWLGLRRPIIIYTYKHIGLTSSYLWTTAAGGGFTLTRWALTLHDYAHRQVTVAQAVTELETAQTAPIVGQQADLQDHGPVC